MATITNIAEYVSVSIRPEDYYTVAETAAILGVSRVRIYQMIGEGRLPSIKFGVAVAVEKRAVDAYERRPRGRPTKRAS